MTSINRTTTTTYTTTNNEKKQIRQERAQKWFTGLSIGFKGLGQTALQTTYAIGLFKHLNRGGCCGDSIFGGIGFRGGCYNPTGFGMFNTGMMMDQVNYQQGMYAADLYGQQLGYQLAQQMLPRTSIIPPQVETNAPKTNAKYAGDVDKNQETETGAKFDTATNEMEDGKTEFKFSTVKDVETYKKDISNLAKSYLMDTDKKAGNSDGKLTKDEFIKKEIAKLDKNLSADKKAQAIAMAEIAFNKIDMNGDNLADWKELAATIATFDNNIDAKSGEKPLDGKIDSKDYKYYSELMAQDGINAFDKMVRTRYTQLFGKDE